MDVPEIRRVKKSHIIPKIVEKPVEVIRTVDVPVKKTIDKIIEKPVYIDKVVDRPY